MGIEFEWDESKNKSNQKKHHVSFETALHIFKDPFLLSRQDRFESGEYRWQAVGLIANQVVVLVAHTSNFAEFTEVIRIISARKATSQEKKAYEQNRSLQTQTR